MLFLKVYAQFSVENMFFLNFLWLCEKEIIFVQLLLAINLNCDTYERTWYLVIW